MSEMDADGKLIINHTVDDDKNVTLFISGDLDIQTAPQLKRFITRMLHESSGNLKLDLSRLSYLDSSGYGVLVDATRRSRKGELRMNLTNMPPWVTDFFDLSFIEGAK